MARVYNFSAGPAMLPESVLRRARDELLEYKDTGMSVMEMSHRSSDYAEIINKTESDLRKLMGIPDNYKVLFLQGGASSQFAMVPLNLMNKSKKADFVHTGAWSKKAIAEAKRYGKVNMIASSEDKNFTYMPEIDESKFDPEADYFHITLNNTIYGTKFNEIPDTGDVPLVADASSNILSEELDVSKFGIIYAGAQKNIGPAGVTIVIIREDLIGNAMDITPTMFNYKTHSDKGSMFNTPPTFSIYIAGLVFEDLLNTGGIQGVQEKNYRKAEKLYSFLDKSSLFNPTVENKEDRSIMNVPFVLTSEEITKKCIAEAAENGLVTLKGHRSVGGMRASIYNAMPEGGVEKLIEFLKDFENKNK
ncbi:MAG: 3-phosphoserine/phosphohydroxythreonine transaminase [Chitinivibrionales bacterium]